MELAGIRNQSVVLRLLLRLPISDYAVRYLRLDARNLMIKYLAARLAHDPVSVGIELIGIGFFTQQVIIAVVLPELSRVPSGIVAESKSIFQTANAIPVIS